jgi:hypothetical protein
LKIFLEKPKNPPHFGKGFSDKREDKKENVSGDVTPW